MGTFGWVLIAGAFLMLIMVANNSWPWVWAKISAGMPQQGQGNKIVSNPSTTQEQNPFTVPSEAQQQQNTPGTIVVPTVNGIIQSA